MYILLCGYPPFGGHTDDQILRRVNAGKFSFPSPEWDFVSFEAKDFIQKMLVMDPAQRITARDALTHTWLSNANTSPINPDNARSIFTHM